MRVVVVWNHSAEIPEGALARAPSTSAPDATARAVVNGLIEAGHTVTDCQGDTTLHRTLARVLPPFRGCPTGMVFNLARGLGGEAARSHVPAMLEMAGIPYTGPGPLAQVVTLDRWFTRTLLRSGGLPTRRACLMRWAGDPAGDLSFPLVAAPRDADAQVGRRIARSARALGDAIDEMLAVTDQEVLVEEFTEGTEISAALLGNDEDLEVFPLITEPVAGSDAPRLAALAPPPDLVARIRAIARSAFRICRCQDYARVVFAVGTESQLQVTGVDGLPALDAAGPYARAAAAAGYDTQALAGRILDLAHLRHYGITAPRYDVLPDDGVSLYAKEPDTPVGQTPKPPRP